MKPATYKFSTPLAYTLVLVSSVLIVAGVYLVTKWCLADAAASATDQPAIAEYAVTLSPGDPQTHLSAAALLEKTFLPQDYDRSLEEYEKAAELSPANYVVWLEYGKALDRHGDDDRAEVALRKSLELAPNYALPKWTLGNFLLRQGKEDEAFRELRAALDSNPAFAEATVQSAYSWFDRDIDQVRALVGKSVFADASIIKLLVREKRLDEAMKSWRSDGANATAPVLKEAESVLLAALLNEKRYRDAYSVYSGDLTNGTSDRSNRVTNGGFEEPIKMQGASPFEWQIDNTPKAPIAIIEGQKHSGSRSLRILFDVTEAKDYRGISQYVVVDPNRKFKFQSFFKSDLKATTPLHWEILDAIDGRVIASTSEIPNTSDWASLSVDFTAPAGSETVIVRLSRDNCPSAICAINGSILLDDISVQPN